MQFLNRLTSASRFDVQLPSDDHPLVKWAVRGYAGAIAIATFLYSFFSPRIPGYEDAGLFNPVYMFLHDGQMTYPAHLYFDAMVIHPPVHYLEIAWLMKLGFGLLRAAGVLVFLPMVLGLWLIVASRFSVAAKLGLMTGPFCTVFIVSMIAGNIIRPDTLIRPELHLVLVWFAALIALESARVENWNSKKLLLGGFLAAYAAGLHYWAAPAIAMPVVYAVWVLAVRGLPKALPPLLALGVGTGLFAVPYLIWFVIPDWNSIQAVLAGVQATGGVGDSITNHFKAFQSFVQAATAFSSTQRLTHVLLMPVTLTGVPMLAIALAIWGGVPGTRGIAVVGSLLPLVVLLGIKRKLGNVYLLPELILYFAGIIMLLLLVLFWLAQRWGHDHRKHQVYLGLVVALAIAVLTQIPSAMRQQVTFTTEDLTKSWKISRAAGQDIMGRNGLVASTTTVTWYTSGAAYWYHIGGDLGYPQFQTKDRQAYLAQFDAIPIEPVVWFVYDQKSLPIPDWYLDRELYLQGFISAPEPALSLLFLSAKQPAQVKGYGMWQGQLYRFQEQPKGDFVNVTLSCVGTDDTWYRPLSSRAMLPTFIYLDAPQAGGRYITSFVMQRQHYEQERSQLTQTCTIRDLVTGEMQPLDERSWITQMEQSDQPIQFFPNLEQALAARQAGRASL